MEKPQLVLASKSPRRRDLLGELGIAFEVVDVDVDESWDGEEAAAAYVERLASAKAEAGWKSAGGALPVLGADTAVVLDNIIMGKPTDRADGLAMLARLSGCTHEVYTAVAIRSLQGVVCRVNRNSVTFRELTESERTDYWQTGEPSDKAGAYAIQGLAGVFVDQLKGSYSGVVGLPLFETAELLAGIGIEALAGSA